MDEQTMLHRPGIFLTAHSDEQQGECRRRAACVIQMCRDWKTTWGGLLHVLNDRSEVTQAFTP